MLQVVEHVDRIDLEKIAELEQSLGWRLITRRIGRMIEEAQHVCETSMIHEDLLRNQGKLEALRRVLELPKILRMEAKRR